MSKKRHIQDPVVEEVRAIRHQIWEQAGGTIKGLLEWLRTGSKQADGNDDSESASSRRRRSA